MVVGLPAQVRSFEKAQPAIEAGVFVEVMSWAALISPITTDSSLSTSSVLLITLITPFMKRLSPNTGSDE